MLFSNIFHLHGGGSRFYPLYIQQSQLVIKASDILLQVLKEDDFAKKKELARAVKEVEKEGDGVDSAISSTLCRVHIVPFEREQVQNLGSGIEKFLDLINDSARKIVIYRPKYIDNVLVEIGQDIREDAGIILEIASLLEHYKKNAALLREKCARIKEIEQEVDDLYECYMSQLFEAEKDGIELTKCKNIVQSLEDTTDAAKEVADCVKMVLVTES